jgi:hypothetical protein
MKTVLVVGATGKTGRSLTEQLLSQGHILRVIVRARDRLPPSVLAHPKMTVIEASILDLSDEQMRAFVKGCDAVVSCLGHVISFKGIFGAPRKLCTDAIRRLCAAVTHNQPTLPVRLILMNTVGVRNPDLSEQRHYFERCVLGLLHWFLPPHADNETASQHLHDHVGTQSEHIHWCSVRPDSLIDGPVSAFDVTESPVTSVFSGRSTTRSNVARFMTQLIDNDTLWQSWRFRMPVIMNSLDRSSHL